MSQKTAKYLRTITHSHADVRLYKLSEPADFRVQSWDVGPVGLIEKVPEQTEFVVVSSVAFNRIRKAPESLIFAATPTGEIISMRQMTGSLFGEINPEKALLNLGYEPI